MEEGITSYHSEIAMSLYPESKNPKDTLFNLGWVMMGSVVYTLPIIHKKPTQSQINKLYDLKLYDSLCFPHGRHFINYKNNIDKLK